MVKKAYPDGIVEAPLEEDSYFWDLQDDLSKKLRRIKGVSFVSETATQAEPDWDLDDDDLPPDSEDEFTRSYYLYFVAPADPAFKYETEMEPFDEELEEEEDAPSFVNEKGVIPGRGQYGCAVGVSLVAPVAAILPSSDENFEDGSGSKPDIEGPYIEDEESRTGRYANWGYHYPEVLGPERFVKLRHLRDQIAKVLQKLHIEVLDDDVVEMPLPKLRGSSEVLIGQTGETLTVKAAFFFKSM